MDKTNAQIHERLIADEDVFSDAFVSLSEVLTNDLLFDLFSDKWAQSSMHALDAILKYYGFRQEIIVPDTVKDPLDRLDYVIKPLGIMQRQVTLEKEWYKSAFGAFLGILDDDTVIALIPCSGGYQWVNSVTGEKVKINRTNADRIRPEAICFYNPLPEGKLTINDLLVRIKRAITGRDVIRLVLCTAAVTLLGMIAPAVTQYIYSQLAVQPEMLPLIITFFLLASATASVHLVSIVKSICLSSLSIKTDVSVSSAVMMRVLNLPVNFFKTLPAGEIHARVESVTNLCSTIIDAVLSSGLTVIMSLVYLIQIFHYSPALVWPALLNIVALTVFCIIVVSVQNRVLRRQMTLSAAENGFTFAMLNGMQKIRLAGAERRFFAQWAGHYRKNAEIQYAPPFIIRYNGPINLLITMLGAALLYYVAFSNRIGTAEYLAFNASYGLLSGAFFSLIDVAMQAASIKPTLEFIQPILDECPEVNHQQQTVTQLSGSIEVNQITFGYDPAAPILDRFSLKINPGEYVAIVGKSGCGKSTLLRLLLGFEKPQQGSISYDHVDISSIDPKTLRRHIGCVMQNAGLFSGSIRSNISISAPEATEEDIWRAAELAGIADDIRKMPMGMNTIIMEGSGTISGGQRQRIIIARAIVTQPDILFLDEATSALDNYTQKIVTDSLTSLHCTRVVIAHRLSTVRDCDRIIMIGNGGIIENGTYEELMEKDGEFAEMVRRQQI